MTDENKDATNGSPLPKRAKDPGFWREVWHQVRLVFYLIRDPEVPIYLKLLPVAAVAYVLFPFDFIPDLAPVVGQLDDVTALLVGAKVFIEMAPPHVVAKYLKRMETQGTDAVGEGDEDDKLKDAIIIDAEHELVSERGQESEQK